MYIGWLFFRWDVICFVLESTKTVHLIILSPLPFVTTEERLNLSFMQYMRTHQFHGDVSGDEVSAFSNAVDGDEAKSFRGGSLTRYFSFPIPSQPHTIESFITSIYWKWPSFQNIRVLDKAKLTNILLPATFSVFHHHMIQFSDCHYKTLETTMSFANHIDMYSVRE